MSDIGPIAQSEQLLYAPVCPLIDAEESSDVRHTKPYRGLVRSIVAIGAVVATLGLLTAAPVVAAAPAAAYVRLLCFDYADHGTGLCVDTAVHNARFSITTGFVLSEDFIYVNSVTTSDGKTWWEIEARSNGYCLNWGGDSHNAIYADNCVLGDKNELFFLNDIGRIVNMGANEYYERDTYLNYTTCTQAPAPNVGYSCPLDINFNPTPLGEAGWGFWLVKVI